MALRIFPATSSGPLHALWSSHADISFGSFLLCNTLVYRSAFERKPVLHHCCLCHASTLCMLEVYDGLLYQLKLFAEFERACSCINDETRDYTDRTAFYPGVSGQPSTSAR